MKSDGGEWFWVDEVNEVMRGDRCSGYAEMVDFNRLRLKSQAIANIELKSQAFNC